MIQLVILPGMDGTGELFKPFLEVLPENFNARTVAYQRDRILSTKEYLEYIRGACKGASPCVLLAESFSTPLAIEFAASNTENLRALVLCAGFASNPVRGLRKFLLRCAMPFLFSLPISDFVLKKWLVGADALPELLQSVRAAISSVHPKVMQDRLRKILSCDQRTNLSNINVPILYLEAKQDRLISRSFSAEIKRIQPLTIVAQLNGPHLILQREPQKAAEIIQNFISTLWL
jgi:pimeloyl-[acyl-carrier protein] methyl ester esterase